MLCHELHENPKIELINLIFYIYKMLRKKKKNTFEIKWSNVDKWLLQFEQA